MSSKIVPNFFTSLFKESASLLFSDELVITPKPYDKPRLLNKHNKKKYIIRKIKGIEDVFDLVVLKDETG